MNKLNKMHKLVTALLISSISLVGCQKKRDAKLPYGSDRELLTINQYEGKDYDLATGNLVQKAQTSGQVRVQDDRSDSKARVRNFDFVEYTAKDPLNLTDKTAMLGRPNQASMYKIRYKFEGDSLKVMKVSRAEDLASDEVASSVDAGQGLRMVPIVSYNVSFYSIDTSRNDLNEKTSRLELVGQQDRGSATHFKVSLNSKSRAVFLSKTTVLPSTYFTADDGKSAQAQQGQSQKISDSRDWYLGVTVTNVNYNESRSGGMVGSTETSDKYGRSAAKVRARKFEDKIVFYNMGIDDRLQQNADRRTELQSAALTIPADLIDFRMSENGRYSSVKEESYKENAWEKRAYAELKLKDVKIAGQDIQISEIKDIQIDDGYFSFLVQSEAVGGLIRISLMNAVQYQKNLEKDGAKPYQRKVYFHDDQRIFGFFSTALENLGGYDRSREKQVEQLTFVNRYNPTRKYIEFRLNADAPAWTEDLMRGAANAWNATFKAAGSNIRIRSVDEKTGKVLRGNPGDLRYSLLNLYTDVDGASAPWLGLGPQLNDPNTGEVIMATANVDLNGSLGSIEHTLSNYLLSSKGAIDQKYILGIPMPSFNVLVDAASKTIHNFGASIGLFKSNNGRVNVYDPTTNSFVKDFTPTNPSQKVAKNPNSFAGRGGNHGSFEVVNGNIVEQVKEVCPDLHNYALGVKNKTASEDQEKETKLVKACAIDLAKPSLMWVILHEMGHDFGLRHNFYGSTDRANFFAPVDVKMGSKKIKTQWASSSVMDYLQVNYWAMTQPGLYDIAALRWGYTDQIEKSDGTIVKVSPDKSTRSQVSDFKNYKYCSDEHAFDGDDSYYAQDPMCRRFDAGTTPSEIVADLILQYDSSIAIDNNRHGQAKMPQMFGLANYRLNKYILPMLGYYEQWRLRLAAQAGPGNEYLENFDTKEKYEALVKKTLNPSVVGEKQAAENADYQKASNMIFGFLMKVAFLPDASCVTERALGSGFGVQLFTFSKIQKNIYFSNGKTVKSCQDPEVVEYLKKEKQANVMAQAGYSFGNLYHDYSGANASASNMNSFDNPETVGIAQDRAFAIISLVNRHNYLVGTRLNQFAPNFMDELPYREYTNYKVVQRLTEGVGVEELGLNPEQFKGSVRTTSPLFESEKPLLTLMFQAVKFGQMIPNKTVETKDRLEKFSLVPYYMLAGDEEGIECTEINGYRWCAHDKHTVSKHMLKKLNELQAMKAAITLDDKAINKFFEIITDLIPANFADLDMTFLDKLEERVEKLTETDKELASQVGFLTQVFMPEIRIWQAGVRAQIKKLQEQDLGKKEAEEAFNKLKQVKIKGLVEKLGVEDYTELTAQTLKKRVTDLVKEVRSAKASYTADPTEISTQADVILESLIGGSPY